MFFIAGIKSKVKNHGIIKAKCPACSSSDTLYLLNYYMTPHIFFIPTFRFNCSYSAVCIHCNSVMLLDKEKGRAVEKGVASELTRDDFTIKTNNFSLPVCPNCGNNPAKNAVFCQHCGAKL